ncbi:MAG: serine/threonine-protein kinase, partial [Chromatiales bacterium]|nr:serine/threonine-protein kinase [Chromatiales bacterium]
MSVNKPPESNKKRVAGIEDLTRTTIGKFQIKRLIGRGATASVYLAEDPFTNTEVAIKIAHQSTFNDPVNGSRFKKMFMNEASLAGKLRHPHIVKVYDAGSEHAMHYIVMEYVAGETLKSFCSPDTLLPVNDVIEIMFKCANALDYAHRHSLIHRDIKPANLLLTNITDVKISDFGAALMADSDLTQIVDAIGTPSYMSPEQVRGDTLNHQSDIYSLGVVMYLMLSGKLPFSAKNQYELVQKVSNKPPVPLQTVRPDLPPEIVAIVMRCLEKDLTLRYQSWVEFSTDLSRINERLELTTSALSDTHKFNTLKSLAFFQEFTDVELWEVLRISSWRNFRSQKKVIEEGKVGSSLVILASGTARIIKNKKLLGIIDAGEVFGETAY